MAKFSKSYLQNREPWQLQKLYNFAFDKSKIEFCIKKIRAARAGEKIDIKKYQEDWNDRDNYRFRDLNSFSIDHLRKLLNFHKNTDLIQFVENILTDDQEKRDEKQRSDDAFWDRTDLGPEIELTPLEQLEEYFDQQGY